MNNKRVLLSKFFFCARVTALLIGVFLWRGSALASKSGDSEQTLSIMGGGSYSTYKSKLAVNNDTGIAYFYGLKILGGESENILVQAIGSSSSVSFALNSTSVKSQELVFYFGYNGSWLELAAGLGNQQIQASLPTSTKFDAYSRVAAALLRTEFELARGSAFFVTTNLLYPLETKEAEKQKLTVGMKINTEIGAVFPLTKKALRLTSGLSYSTQTISFNSTSGAETMISPFVAISYGIGM